MDDQPMFAVPARYRKPVKGDATKVSWREHRGKRETCGLCILDIRDGLLRAPMATATRVATVAGHVWFLCKSHAHEVKQGARRLPTS